MSLKKQAARFIFILAIALGSSCSMKNQVDFKKGLPSVTTVTAPATAIGATGGGYSNQTTTNGYKVSLSVDSALNQVSGTTAGGYKVELNLQGQMSQ